MSEPDVSSVPPPQPGSMPPDATIFMVRHAEKPDKGDGLSLAGEQRADAYRSFLTAQRNPGGELITWQHVFASHDSTSSARPLLTIAPTADEIGVVPNTDYADNDYQKLADDISSKQAKYQAKNILICWHHGHILDLATALGASWKLLPGSSNFPKAWNPVVFGWLLKLFYTADGAVGPPGDPSRQRAPDARRQHAPVPGVGTVTMAGPRPRRRSQR